MTAFSLTKVGRIGSGTGPYYYPSVVDTSEVTDWPWSLTLVSSPDHAGGGINMIGAVGDPTDPANWESYNTALAAGRFDAFATKPAANPIYNDPDTADSETPHLVKIGSDWYLTSHDNIGGDYQVTRLAIATGAPLNFTRVATDDGKIIDLAAAPLTEYPQRSPNGGYFRWGLNPFSGVAYTYVGYSLHGGTDSGHQALWGSNDALSWTMIKILDSVIDDSLPTSPTPWATKITEIDPQSITYAGGGEYIALCPCGNPASGAVSRYSDLYEIYLAADGYTLTREPRLVLSRGGVGSFDEYEIGQPTTIEYGGTKLCFYQGADSSAANSLMLATFTLDATVAKPDPISRRNHDKLVYDATGSAALPAWLENEGTAPVPGANGLAFTTSTSGVKFASDLDPSVKTWVEMSMKFAYQATTAMIPRFQIGNTGPGTTEDGFLVISYASAGGTALGYVELIGKSATVSTETAISTYALNTDAKKRHHIGIELDLATKIAKFTGNSYQPKAKLAITTATMPNPFRPRISQGYAGGAFILAELTLRMTPDAAGIAPTVASSVVASTTVTLTLSEDCIGDGTGLLIKVGGVAVDGVWTRTALDDMVFTRDTGTFGESDAITLDVIDTDLRNETDLVAIQNVTDFEIQTGGSTLSPNIINQSATTDIDISITRNLNASLLNQSTTTDIDRLIFRSLAASLTNQSSTTDVDISIVGLISLIANIINQSTTSDIGVVLNRALSVNLSNNSATTDIDILLAALIQLVCSISNDSSTSDIDKVISRALSASLANQTLTSDDVSILLGSLILLASDILTIKITQDNLSIRIN